MLKMKSTALLTTYTQTGWTSLCRLGTGAGALQPHQSTWNQRLWSAARLGWNQEGPGSPWHPSDGGGIARRPPPKSGGRQASCFHGSNAASPWRPARPLSTDCGGIESRASCNNWKEVIFMANPRFHFQHCGRNTDWAQPFAWGCIAEGMRVDQRLNNWTKGDLLRLSVTECTSFSCGKINKYRTNEKCCPPY